MKKIWGKEDTFVGEGLEEIEPRGPRQEDVVITEAAVEHALMGMANWRGCGPDGVYLGFIKRLPGLWGELARLYRRMLTYEEDVEENGWLVEGRTLCQRKVPSGVPAGPGDWRPVTCLNHLYKVLTKIINVFVVDHLEKTGRVAVEQQSGKQKIRGCQGALLIDRTVIEDAKKRRKRLVMTFFDFRKAFDSLSQSGLDFLLHQAGVAENVQAWLVTVMPLWRTRLERDGSRGGYVDMKSGIQQGDSLSPTLFLMVMACISRALARLGVGYRLGPKQGPKGKDKTEVSHLMYVDDVKTFAGSEEGAQRQEEEIRRIGEQFGLKLNEAKSARIHMAPRGAAGELEVKPPPHWGPARAHQEAMREEIAELGPLETYRYLGVDQNRGGGTHDAKREAREKYNGRVAQAAACPLDVRDKIQIIDTWAVPVIRYGYPVLNWTQSELRQMDEKTRKTLREKGLTAKKEDVDWLYLPRKSGGRGLRSAEDTYLQETAAFKQYVEKELPDTDLLRQVAGSKHIAKAGYPIQDLLNRAGRGMGNLGLPEETEEDPTDAISVQQEAERRGRIKKKHAGGRMLKTFEDPKVDGETSRGWHSKTDLPSSVEKIIFAVRQDTLGTKGNQHKWGLSETDRCRWCGKEKESICHLVAGCKALNFTYHTRRHDLVCKEIHINVARRIGALKSAGQKPWNYSPDRIVMRNGHQLFWDRDWGDAARLEHSKPDIVWVRKKEVLVIEVATPADHNVGAREEEKTTKYIPLCGVLAKLFRKPARVVPIVVGATGVVSKNLVKNAATIDPCISPTQLQRIAATETARMAQQLLVAN